MIKDDRPNPDALLAKLKSEEKTHEKGKLKIFFGYSAGVGKTYSMLEEAQVQHRRKVDVLVGYIEPHTRPETMALMRGLPSLPMKEIQYKNMSLKEFDLDKALEIHPELILVDELAHSNPPSFRNKKRYQDIEELINAGIDVYTTINVQHVESLKDVVSDITKISVKERVPDFFLDNADKIELIDVDPEELLSRFKEGKIYSQDKVELALEGFFTYENLSLLREVGMRRVADRITKNACNLKKARPAFSKIMVCVSPSPSSAHCIRTTAIMAEAFHCQWVALYVKSSEGEFLTQEDEKNLQENMDIAETLGAEIAIMQGEDKALVISEYAKLSGITNIVIGKGDKEGFFKKLFKEGMEDQILLYFPEVEVHIIPHRTNKKKINRAKSVLGEKMKKALSFSWSDTVITLGILVLATIISYVLRYFYLGDQNIVMVYILSVLIVSRMTKGYLYGICASVIGVLSFNFLFIEPYFTFNAISPTYPVTFMIMLIVALITSALTNAIKIQAKVAVEGEQRTEILYEINRNLLKTHGLENIVDLTNDFLVEIFGRSAIFYSEKSEDSIKGTFKQGEREKDQSYLTEKDEEAVAHWAFVNGKPAGRGTDTLAGAKGYYIPIMSQGKALGVIGIACNEAPFPSKRRLFLNMMLAQVAMAMERQRLSDEQAVIK